MMETAIVPIGRVLTNLEQRLRVNSNDVATLYNLGRVHSMAFADPERVEVEVAGKRGQSQPMGEPFFGYFDTGIPDGAGKTNAFQAATSTARAHLTNAVFYYQRAARLLNQGTNATANRWLASPIQLGLAWSLDQAQRRPEAIQAYR